MGLYSRVVLVFTQNSMGNVSMQQEDSSQYDKSMRLPEIPMQDFAKFKGSDTGKASLRDLPWPPSN